MPPSDMSPDKQKVLVLTAGHVAVPKEEFSRYLTGSIINEVPKPFIANADTEYPQTYHFIVTLNHFLDVPENQARHVHVRRIIVATMLGTDLALLELDITYGELKALNITPAPLAQSQPKLGEIITAHGHPVELNLPIAAPGQVIRAESISAEGFNWSYSYAINASVAEGVSGGPAFNKNGEVVGIVNVAARDVNYIQPVSQLREIFENGDVSFEKIRLNPTLSPHLLDGSCNSMLKPK